MCVYGEFNEVVRGLTRVLLQVLELYQRGWTERSEYREWRGKGRGPGEGDRGESKSQEPSSGPCEKSRVERRGPVKKGHPLLHGVCEGSVTVLVCIVPR